MCACLANMCLLCRHAHNIAKYTYTEAATLVACMVATPLLYVVFTSKIMWNIGMAKETRSGCLVHIVL